MHAKHFFSNLKLVCYITLIAILGCFQITQAQTDQALITALNSKIIPVKTLSPDDDLTDLQVLKPILKDKNILGLGEASHGTHEFFLYKHRLMEFLVKEMGYKNFVIEANFAGTQTMNNYVLYGKGNVYMGLWGMGMGAWMTQEVVDMANWVKDYNAGKPLSERVRFYGCDIQGNQAAGQAFKRYLTTSGQMTPILDSGITLMAKYGSQLTKNDKAEIRSIITALRQISLTKLDADSAAIFTHDIRAVEQYMDMMDAESTLFPARSTEMRDKYMAENCEWIYDHINHDKMMIWAHNGHITSMKNSSGIFPMGEYLKQNFKDNYYALGFAFNSGAIRSYDETSKQYQNYDIPAPTLKNSADAVFALCNYPNFILDFKSASSDPAIAKFLTTDTWSHALGAYFIPSLKSTSKYYVKQKLADAYDGIVFLRETTAAQAEKVSK